MNLILVLIILFLVVIIILIKKLNFGATPNNYTLSNSPDFPNPFNGFTSNDIKKSSIINTSKDIYDLGFSNNSSKPNIKCYTYTPDYFLDYNNGITWSLQDQNDLTLVNFYLTKDCYASDFMLNSNNVILPTTFIDISKYTNIGTNTDIKNTTPTTIPSKISFTPTGVTTSTTFYKISWDNALKLDSTKVIKPSDVKDSGEVIIKKIKTSILYSLIKLYYNPTLGSGIYYNGLINDFSNNYKVNTPSSSNTSTSGITFTTSAKHAIWIYLLARAAWINNLLLTNTY